MVFEFDKESALVSVTPVNGGVLRIRFDFGKTYPVIVTLDGKKPMRYKSIDTMLKGIAKLDGSDDVKKVGIVMRIISKLKRKEKKDGTQSGK